MKRSAITALLLGLAALSARAGTVTLDIADFGDMADSVSSVVAVYRQTGLSQSITNTYTPSANASIYVPNRIVESMTLYANLNPGYGNAKFVWYAANYKGGTVFDQGELQCGSGGVTVPFLTQPGTEFQLATFVTNLTVTPNTYTLTFNPNGGTVLPNSKTITYREKYGTLPVPTRTGYRFDGWMGEGRIWTGNETVETLENQTFTAQWTPITYTVTFGANGGTGTMAPQSFTYDEAQTLAPCAFSFENYSFRCWTNAVTGLTYLNGAQVSNLTNVQGAVVALDAVWVAKSYEIHYHRNYSSDIFSTQQISYGETVTLASALGRTGYKFLGWALSSDATTSSHGANEMVSSSDFTFDESGVLDLYAVWGAYSYTVSFSENGGTGSMEPVSRVFDDGEPLPACAFTRAGYTFVGWARTARGTVEFADLSTANVAEEDKAAVILYAVWAPISYNVVFEPNDVKATNEMAGVSMVYDRPSSLPACAFGKDGYDFIGWALASAGEVEYADRATVSNLTITAGADVPLYARWKAQSYTVTLDANGGAFTENGLAASNITVTVDETYGALPAPTNALPKFVFNEWRTLAGAPVASGDLVPPPSAGITNLVAHWVKDDPLARAVDAEQLDFNQHSQYGKGAWSEVKNVSDGVGGDYAQASIAAAAGWRQDIISMTAEVEGPGTLTFRWKILSNNRPWEVEQVNDQWDYSPERLFFSVGGAKQFGIVGAPGVSMRFTEFRGEYPAQMEEKARDPDWIVETVRIEAKPGAKTELRWTFHAFEDELAPGHAWVDAVHWVPDEGTVIFFR